MRPEGVRASKTKCHVRAALDDRAEESAADREWHTLQRHLLCKSQLEFYGSLLIPHKGADRRPGSSNATSMPGKKDQQTMQLQLKARAQEAPHSMSARFCTAASRWKALSSGRAAFEDAASCIES